MPLLIGIGILLAIAAYVVSLYNFFQTAKARIKASVQEIGKPSVKGFLKQEKEIFKMLPDPRKQITAAADSGDMGQIDAAMNQLQSILPKIQVAVEDNPEIKSDSVITKLMDELRDTADKVMYARRTVIDLAADYNIKRVTFPSNLVASIFGFTEEKGLDTPMSGEHIEVSASEMKDPKIEL